MVQLIIALVSGQLLAPVDVEPGTSIAEVRKQLEIPSRTPARFIKLLRSHGNGSDAELHDSATVGDAGMLDRLEITLVRVVPNSLSIFSMLEDSPLMLRYLLECHADLEQEEGGLTPLHWAVRGGMTKISLALVELVPSKVVNHRVRKDRGTVLHWAARLGFQDVCHAVLARDDFDAATARDVFGMTASDWAAQEGHQTLCRLLPSNGTRRPQIGYDV
mmetsp:Transcript_49628/g.111563  ORF Transcript_49628/g.111563 Transcript_49628/m.111563 type:complete len:218 (+) Transcript_49628:63-716(+)